MARKHRPEEIIGKLREAKIVLAQGGTVADACRRIGVTEQSCYRCRKEYGGLKMDQARRMKELEKVNARLRRAVSDLALAEPKILIEAWRRHYNTVKPHSSLGYRPPAPETAKPALRFRYAPPAASHGAGSNLALTINADHSVRARQDEAMSTGAG